MITNDNKRYYNYEIKYDNEVYRNSILSILKKEVIYEYNKLCIRAKRITNN